MSLVLKYLASFVGFSLRSCMLDLPLASAFILFLVFSHSLRIILTGVRHYPRASSAFRSRTFCDGISEDGLIGRICAFVFSFHLLQSPGMRAHHSVITVSAYSVLPVIFPFTSPSNSALRVYVILPRSGLFFSTYSVLSRTPLYIYY